MKKPTSELMPEVARLVREGHTVALPVSGNSMLPFIMNGGESVELHRLPPVMRCGDVVLALTLQGHYVLHRVVHMAPGLITLEGDGNTAIREQALPSHVIARAEWVADARGRRRSLVSPTARMKWQLWHRMRPLRRILLKVWKIINGVDSSPSVPPV